MIEGATASLPGPIRGGRPSCRAPVMVALRGVTRTAGLLLPLALAACGVMGWEEPSRGLQTTCDEAGARGNVGRPTDADARPRPECRPGQARR